MSCRVAAVLLILAVAVLRVVYLACDCPLDLAPDEAHYWDWSRRLDWSYYSKGPLVAWLIRGSCELFGGWSVQMTGNEMLAVRLPAVVCGSLLLLALYVLTVQVYRSERLALAVVALSLTLPVLAAGSSLMTIDAPYTCAWGWALVLGYRAVFVGSASAWPLLGLAVGLGTLAKYNMVLFVPSLVAFLLTTPRYRPLLYRRGFWLMAAIAGLCCLPILVWNVQNGWVTLRHVGSLAGGMKTESRWHWSGPVDYVAGQCGLLLIFWFIAWAGAMVEHRPWVESDESKRYLWWLSLPMFAVFLAFSFKTGGGELNWPATAYLSGLVLAAGWLVRQLCSPAAWYRRMTMANLTLACGAGVAIIVLVHRAEWLRRIVEPLAGPPTAANPMPLRQLDPTCRLRGWRTLAGEVDRVCAALRAEGVEPVLAGSGWALPGEVGFYCQGHPAVYSVGLAQGDRHSQYDLWRPNPVADPDHFRGRTFVIVGFIGPDIRAAFRQVDPPRAVIHAEDGQPVAAWQILICRDFHGFRRPATPTRY